MATHVQFHPGTGTLTPVQQQPPQQQQLDLLPLFYNILGNVSVGPGERKMSPEAIANGLSQNQETLLLFQSAPYTEIREIFKKYLKTIENKGKVGGTMCQTLDCLYDISLINSSTKQVLEQRNQELPSLQEKVSPGLKEEIHLRLREAKNLLEEAKEYKELGHIETGFSKTDALLRKLNEYRVLKQYTDVHENQRALDLATAYARMHASQQFPKFISDYPEVVRQIEFLKNELNLVSSTVVALNTLKMELQKTKAALLNATKSVADPLQARFIDAFSIPVYNAFAWHFWTMAWNSSHETEVAALTQKIPSWNKANPNVVDPTILNCLWTNFFPAFTFEDWMLKSLKSVHPSVLKELEQKLQPLEKKRNETMASKTIEKDTKTQIQTSILQEMKGLCVEATKPPYSTLTELRNFLNSSA